VQWVEVRSRPGSCAVQNHTARFATGSYIFENEIPSHGVARNLKYSVGPVVFRESTLRSPSRWLSMVEGDNDFD